MKRFAILFAFGVVPTSAFADYWFCEYTQQDPKTPTTFYSAVFGTADENVGPRINSSSMDMNGRPSASMPSGISGSSSNPSRRQLGDAFARYVTGDRAHGAASCRNSPTRSGAERDLQRKKDKAIEKQHAVVQSDWIPSAQDM